jgi:hypothetical protein
LKVTYAPVEMSGKKLETVKLHQTLTSKHDTCRTQSASFSMCRSGALATKQPNAAEPSKDLLPRYLPIGLGGKAICSTVCMYACSHPRGDPRDFGGIALLWTTYVHSTRLASTNLLKSSTVRYAYKVLCIVQGVR